MRVDTWSPFVMKPYLLEPWVMETLEELASKAPFGNGRVSLGFAFDGWFLPKEMIVDVFEKVKKMGIKLITTHYVRGVLSGEMTFLSALVVWTSQAEPVAKLSCLHCSCKQRPNVGVDRDTIGHWFDGGLWTPHAIDPVFARKQRNNG